MSEFCEEGAKISNFTFKNKALIAWLGKIVECPFTTILLNHVIDSF